MATTPLATAQDTNSPATNIASAMTESVQPAETLIPSTTSSRGFDDSAFRIVAERNIFNANRSGGQVRLSSSRRPARVESFTLVGTMAYEKGAFAFFNGSSSEFSKVIKAGAVIAGHKVVDVLANAVKLEADGRVYELPVGAAMRREDEGTWRFGEGVAGSSGASYASNRESESTTAATTVSGSTSTADESEVLKRLLERRERESQ